VASDRITFADVLRVREFRVLWLADAQSAAGDQLARVALSVLVFERTASAVLTALAYALTFLPALIGGVLLSGLADRLPRRRVLVGCDLVRVVLVGLMALPGMSLWLLGGLLILVVLVDAPFSAADSALVPDILDGEHYVVATGLRTITNQLSQLAGFAGGGIVIAAIGARAGLAVDAATFALSALLIMAGVHARPAPYSVATEGHEHPPNTGMLSSFTGGVRLIWRNRKLRTLLAMAWLAGLYVVPEGVAAPYADVLGGGATAVGLLMAAMPAGTALGTYLFLRCVRAQARPRWMGPLAAVAGVPLVLCAGTPGITASVVLWAVSGLCFAYQVQVIAEFMRTVPDSQRGQAVGIASSGLLAVQGLGVLLGGFVAGRWGTEWAVAGAGALGAVFALGLTSSWARASRDVELADPAPVTSAES